MKPRLGEQPGCGAGHDPTWHLWKETLAGDERANEASRARVSRRGQGSALIERVRPIKGMAIVRDITDADCPAVARIYNHYVANTIVTFEEQPVSPEEMAVRVREVRDAHLPWLVAEVDGEVVGYACASRWKGRCAYRFSVEITVYIDPGHAGKGLGSMLYGELFPILRGNGTHVVIGGIALPNDASVALHEKFGLEKVGHFREVGYKLGRWVDVGYWQRTIQPADGTGSAGANCDSDPSSHRAPETSYPHLGSSS